MNKSDISQYVAGKTKPSQDKLVVLGKALDVSESWLMGLDVSKERAPSSDDNLRSDYLYELPTQKKSNGILIPVLGRVAAGLPIEAIENIIDYEEITQEMAMSGEFFGLKIKGDSMEPRICDGDVVIVRKQDDADAGNIVIALVNGQDATCKRLNKYSSGIGLQSLNPKYEPMMFTKQDINDIPVKILGKVVELRGKL
ncbi:MAG: repressor LexA [Lachnospiraceae bacterium]|nr:repressor LexA [Lachnospiraceae bacterium]